MNVEQYIPYVSVAVTVAAVTYALVAKRKVGDIVAAVKEAVDQGTAAHAEIAGKIRKPLEDAVKQLPKTRSKKAAEGGDVQ